MSNYLIGIDLFRQVVGNKRYQTLLSQVPQLDDIVGATYESAVRDGKTRNVRNLSAEIVENRISILESELTPEGISDFAAAMAFLVSVRKKKVNLEPREILERVPAMMQGLGYNPNPLYSY